MEKSSTPPPIICINDRVLIQYAVLNDSVGFAPGHGLFFIDGKEIGWVPYLAICENKESQELALYFCGGDWSPVGIVPCDSIEAAKRKAECIYPGSSACWVEAHSSENDVKRFVGEAWETQRCSFCGKRPDQDHLSAFFQGNGSVRICDECIRQFGTQLGHSKT
jgi:hypothetical protein